MVILILLISKSSSGDTTISWTVSTLSSTLVILDLSPEKITEYLSNEELIDIEDKVRNSAYEVIKRKGATCYGIGACMVRITNSILEDKKVILAVSSYDEKNDVCISTPTVVGKNGVSKKIHIPLSEDEKEKLQDSINVIKNAIISLDI